MEIQITKEDAQNCKGYNDTENCLFATALKRTLGRDTEENGDPISVGGTYVRLDGKMYAIVNWKAICDVYDNGLENLEPFTVILEER